MKKQTILYVIGGLATVGLGYTLLTVLKKKPQTFGEAVKETKETVVTLPNVGVNTIKKVVSTIKTTTSGFPLKKGSVGINIKKLQRFLNDESGDLKLVVDGIFGTKTENAVIENQYPFATFKMMHPTAIKGQVSEEFFNDFIKNY